MWRLSVKKVNLLFQYDTTLRRRYDRTNIFIMDSELWAWAQYRAKTLGKDSVSGYIFDLIKADRDKGHDGNSRDVV